MRNAKEVKRQTEEHRARQQQKHLDVGNTGPAADHGTLTGLADDDHAQYVHKDAPRTITAQHDFAPSTAQAPFTLGANAQGQLVAGLRAAQVDKTIIAGDALTGGGTLTSDVTIDLDTPGTLDASTINSPTGSHTHAISASSNPGANEEILKSTATGALTLELLTVDNITLNGSTISATADLTINPAGGDVLLPSAVNIGADNFASKTTGWRVDYDGTADFRYIYADELHVESFIADLEQALAGGQIVSKSVALLSRDLEIPYEGAIAQAGRYAITGISTLSDYFIISGDHTERIDVGDDADVIGSTGNDGAYTVSNVVYSSPNTLVYVNEDITDGNADGQIEFGWFTVSGDHAATMLGRTFGVDGSTGNDGSYTASSTSYRSAISETRILTASTIADPTNDGVIESYRWFYIEDLPNAPNTAAFTGGDWVRFRYIDRDPNGGLLQVADVWGVVSSYTDQANGEQRWTLRVKDDAGLDGSTIQKGAIVLDYGTSTDGYWEVTALGNNAPYSQIVTWTDDPTVAGNHTTKTRLGNLTGITDTDFSGGVSGYGIYSTNAFLKGEVWAAGGDVILDSSGLNIIGASNLQFRQTAGASFSTKIEAQAGAIGYYVAGHNTYAGVTANRIAAENDTNSSIINLQSPRGANNLILTISGAGADVLSATTSYIRLEQQVLISSTGTPSEDLHVSGGNAYMEDGAIYWDNEDPVQGKGIRLMPSASGGIDLRLITSQNNATPIFRVLSTGGAERLKVEHNGETKTDNDFYATGTIRAGNVLDIDGTGLSTIAGSLTVSSNLTVVDSTTFYVNASTARVSIGAGASPSYDLHVVGTSRITGTALFDGFTGVGQTGPQFQLDVYDNNPVNGYAARIFADGGASGDNGLAIRAGQDSGCTADMLLFQDGNGTTIGSVAGGGSDDVNFNTTSDERQKENIEVITGVFSKIDGLEPITYTGKGLSKRSAGVTAQQVEAIVPELVTTRQNGLKQLDYGRAAMIVATAGLREAKQRIDQLEQEVSVLRSQLRARS